MLPSQGRDEGSTPSTRTNSVYYEGAIMFRALAIKELLRDRVYTTSLAMMLLMAFFVLIISMLNIRPNELNVPIKYSGFDPREISLGQWFYLLNFPIFAALVSVLHLLISAKLYRQRGRGFALGFIYLGLIILSVLCLFSMGLFKVVSLRQ